MTSSDVDREANRLTPAEAFKIIGNETRVTILQELAETKDRPVAFTELRKRVGIRDGSQFNYHLQKLENGFVRKTDAGYYITHNGLNVLSAIVRGAFTESASFGPVALDSTCVDCGAPLEGHYEEEVVSVECSACEQLHTVSKIPQSGFVGRSERELLVASDQKLRGAYRLVVADVCPGCAGRMDRTLVLEPVEFPDSLQTVETADKLDFEHGPGAVYRCTQCERWAYLSVGEHLLETPELVEFFRDHGRDLDDIPLWELPWTLPFVADEYTSVTATDPPAFEVHIPLDGDVFVATLDEAFDVVDATTIDATSPATL